MKRHDYLPFGEEIGGPQVALLGGRTTTQGYTGDSVRQHFTGYEADGETGLNFAEARYQSPTQGRFTSVDPLGASATVLDPQSFNRYSYVNNNPTNLTDPTGMMTQVDASMSYGDVAGLWAGGSLAFGGPETGQSIIAAAAAGRDQAVADTIKANGLNDALRKGKITPFQAFLAVLDAGGRLGIENSVSSKPEVRVADVALAASPREDAPIVAHGNVNEFDFGDPPERYTLDVNQGDVDPDSTVFSVAVTFRAMNTSGWVPDSLKVEVPSNGRWKLADIADIPAVRRDEGTDRFTVQLNLKARDLEANNRAIRIQVSAYYSSLYRLDQSAGVERRSVTGKIALTLIRGKANLTTRDVP